MLELRFIRENLSLVKEKTERRGIKDSRIEDFEAIDTKRRELLGELESLRNKRKTVSSEIAVLKKENKDADTLIADMREAGERIKALEKQVNEVEESLNEIVMGIPNLCHDSVPEGIDDTENEEIRKWGTIPEGFGYPRF
jgi:seryl-tRNA synthetase